MESYRNIWNNLFNYLKEHWSIKDCEKIEEYHILAYIDYKIEYYPSKQYLQKIISAIGKLEIALNRFSKQYKADPKLYNFDIRKYILQESIDLKFVANNYHNRAYKNPEFIISNLLNPLHKLAATIELQGGARIEACSLIKQTQLLGYKIDTITNTKKGIIFTKEKGGKEGEVLVSIQTYNQLKQYFTSNKIFKINRQTYMKDIRDTCKTLGVVPKGSHGFRWNFAKNRMLEYAKAGYSYQDSLQQVSYEMKHNRASITEHYLG
jgi:integrase